MSMTSSGHEPPMGRSSGWSGTEQAFEPGSQAYVDSVAWSSEDDVRAEREHEEAAERVRAFLGALALIPSAPGVLLNFSGRGLRVTDLEVLSRGCR